MIGLTVRVTGEKNCVGDNCEKNCVGDNCEKNCVGDKCEKNCVGDKCECVGDKCESDKCDSESINKIIKNRDVEEEELLKDAFWSVDGRPYPNMQNPTVAYVHYGHCTKVVKEKSYEKIEEKFMPIEKKFNELRKVFENDTTDDKEIEAAFNELKEIRDAFKSKLDMETKHFDHCDKLLTKTEKSRSTKKVLRETNGFNEAQKDTYCLKTFSQYSSAKAEWWFGYGYFFYISAVSKKFKTSSLERIAADNFGEYIMSGKKKGLVKKYDKELKKKSVKELNTLAHYCQTKPIKFDYCQLPAETGRCKANIKRWFFNTASQKCETFKWGGCDGNENNFITERECSITCDSEYQKIEECKPSCASVDCLLGMCVDSCPLASTYLVMSKGKTYCADNDTNEFVGCADAECINEQCNMSCDNVRCAFGLCVESCPDPRTNIVKGKGNTYCANTLTGKFVGCVKIECPDKEKFDYCQLPAETGECEAIIKRWFFNTASQKCETFKWGGCDGNENNFNTENECSITCDSKDEIKG